MAMVVVLPAPFGPMKPATTPRGSSSVRWSTTVRCPYRFVRPDTETALVMAPGSPTSVRGVVRPGEALRLRPVR